MNDRDELFGICGHKWKNKYTVGWCDLCDVAIVICPECNNSSCNGSGCESCIKDNEDWSKVKKLVENYLTPEEIKTYYKSLHIKEFIKECIRCGENEINWKRLYEEGKMSQHEITIFKEFIPVDAKPYEF